MAKGKLISIVDELEDHVLIEKNGQKLNLNITHLLEDQIITEENAYNNMDVPTDSYAPTGTGYQVNKDAYLPIHSHDENSLHSVEVITGSIEIITDTTTSILKSGDIIAFKVGENHSIKVLEDNTRTVHWRVKNA